MLAHEQNICKGVLTYHVAEKMPRLGQSFMRKVKAGRLTEEGQVSWYAQILL